MGNLHLMGLSRVGDAVGGYFRGVGSFPSTPILDNGARANEDPLSDGGNWNASSFSPSDGVLKLVSSEFTGSSYGASSIASQIWDGVVNNDQEYYLTMVTTTSGGFQGGYLRATNYGTNPVTGYQCYYSLDGANMVIRRFDNFGSATVLFNESVSLADGDKIGARVAGAVGSTWYFEAGAGIWQQLGSDWDASGYSSGKIGILSGQNNFVHSRDFGGGSS